MRTILFSIINGMFFLNMLLLAQEKEETQYLTDSSKSIQFGITSFLSPAAFNNKSISYKTNLSTISAIRIGIIISGSHQNDDTKYVGYTNDTLISRKNSSYNRSPNINLALSVQYLLYIPTQSQFYLFYGAGPEVEYSRSEMNYDVNTSRSIGIAGMLGAEWFASQRFSLHAEYITNASLSFESHVDWYSSTTIGGSAKEERWETKSTIWSLHSSRVLFGASIYF